MLVGKIIGMGRGSNETTPKKSQKRAAWSRSVYRGFTNDALTAWLRVERWVVPVSGIHSMNSSAYIRTRAKGSTPIDLI